RKHMAHMAGSGLFDIIKNVGKKAIEVGKKAYDFYDKNKDVIHKGIELGIEHAPKVYDILKTIKGGKMTAGSRPMGGKRIGGKRKLPTALKEWQDECKKYAKTHKCTYKQAMVALKKH
ncbi:hypothetical protein, partial [Clostridium sp.]|uniref:hypothetical protein n=1 Tax=Clostridium sp. TaxID=1506 RepID=UPI002851C240